MLDFEKLLVALEVEKSATVSAELITADAI